MFAWRAPPPHLVPSPSSSSSSSFYSHINHTFHSHLPTKPLSTLKHVTLQALLHPWLNSDSSSLHPTTTSALSFYDHYTRYGQVKSRQDRKTLMLFLENGKTAFTSRSIIKINYDSKKWIFFSPTLTRNEGSFSRSCRGCRRRQRSFSPAGRVTPPTSEGSTVESGWVGHMSKCHWSRRSALNWLHVSSFSMVCTRMQSVCVCACMWMWMSVCIKHFGHHGGVK